MKFTLKQLRYFEAVLRTGSIARAAVEMNISQSSITAAIDTLEKLAGTELIRRMPAKGVKPTEKGAQMLLRIQEYLDVTRVFESDILSLSGDPTGTLRLGCYAPSAHYVLPPILRQIAQDYPSINIDLKEGDAQSITDFLNTGGIDLALTYRRFTPASQPFIPLFPAKPVALIPSEWPLARTDEIAFKDLADLPMILLDLPGTKAYFTGLFESEGLRPTIAHTTKSSPVLRGLVGAKFGYALLNICDPADRGGQFGYVVKRVVEGADTPHFGIAYSQASQRSSIVQSVLKTCKEIGENGAFNHLQDY